MSSIMACYICGEEGHYASKCPARATKKCPACGGFGHDVRSCVTSCREQDECGCCGGKGHLSSNCPNKKSKKRDWSEIERDTIEEEYEATYTRSRVGVKRYKTKGGVCSIESEFV